MTDLAKSRGRTSIWLCKKMADSELIDPLSRDLVGSSGRGGNQGGKPNNQRKARYMSKSYIHICGDQNGTETDIIPPTMKSVNPSLLLLLASFVVFCFSATTLLGQPLNNGDLVIAEGESNIVITGGAGRVGWFRDGQAQPNIRDYSGSLPYCVFRLDSKLYVCERGGVRVLGPNFEDLGRFGPDLGSVIVSSIVFDRTGNSYWAVGDNILKVDAGGQLVSQFQANSTSGVWQLDLASDQCTLVFTQIVGQVGRYDVCLGSRLTDLTTALPPAGRGNIRILPDGTVLVPANGINSPTTDGAIYRVDTSGQVLQTFDTPGAADWDAVAVGSSGTTLWAHAFRDLYEFDLSSGTLIRGPISTQYRANAMLVAGEFRAASETAAIPMTSRSTLAFLFVVLALIALTRITSAV